jgi:hypothetical protein
MSTLDDLQRGVKHNLDKSLLVGGPKCYVVSIGVSNYKHASPLANAVADAKRFSKFWKTQACLTYTESVIIVDENASATAIEGKLRWVSEQAGFQDNIIVFLAGHGEQDQTSKSEGYFLAWDGVAGDTKIPFRRICNELSNSRAAHVLIVADICFGGGIGRHQFIEANKDLMIKDPVTEPRNAISRYFIASARSFESATDGPPGEHSPFLRDFIDAVRLGAAAQPDGITARTLGTILEELSMHRANSKQKTTHGSLVQRFTGEFIIAKTKPREQSGYPPFVDRDEALGELKQLPKGRQQHSFLVRGMSGSGTSRLIRQYADQREAEDACLVLYVKCNESHVDDRDVLVELQACLLKECAKDGKVNPTHFSESNSSAIQRFCETLRGADLTLYKNMVLIVDFGATEFTTNAVVKLLKCVQKALSDAGMSWGSEKGLNIVFSINRLEEVLNDSGVKVISSLHRLSWEHVAKLVETYYKSQSLDVSSERQCKIASKIYLLSSGYPMLVSEMLRSIKDPFDPDDSSYMQKCTNLLVEATQHIENQLSHLWHEFPNDLFCYLGATQMFPRFAISDLGPPVKQDKSNAISDPEVHFFGLGMLSYSADKVYIRDQAFARLQLITQACKDSSSYEDICNRALAYLQTASDNSQVYSLPHRLLSCIDVMLAKHMVVFFHRDSTLEQSIDLRRFIDEDLSALFDELIPNVKFAKRTILSPLTELLKDTRDKKLDMWVHFNMLFSKYPWGEYPFESLIEAAAAKAAET